MRRAGRSPAQTSHAARLPGAARCSRSPAPQTGHRGRPLAHRRPVWQPPRRDHGERRALGVAYRVELQTADLCEPATSQRQRRQWSSAAWRFTTCTTPGPAPARCARPPASCGPGEDSFFPISPTCPATPKYSPMLAWSRSTIGTPVGGSGFRRSGCSHPHGHPSRLTPARHTMGKTGQGVRDRVTAQGGARRGGAGGPTTGSHGRDPLVQAAAVERVGAVTPELPPGSAIGQSTW